jgi:hypothetical protein
VQRFKSEGIQTIFPLISFLQLVDFAQAEKEQTYFPRLMLSDYEQGLNVALGMLDLGYQKSVDGLTGPTFFVLGNSDDPRGYDAQAMDCWQVFRKRNLGTYKNTDGSTWNGYIESTGVASKACETIRLFAAAARNAGPVLTRVGWANAMKAMTDFQGTTVPYQSFSQTRRSGAHRMRIVQVHENTDKRCPKKVDGGDQGTCWLIIQDFQEHLQL